MFAPSETACCKAISGRISSAWRQRPMSTAVDCCVLFLLIEDGSLRNFLILAYLSCMRLTC